MLVAYGKKYVLVAQISSSRVLDQKCPLLPRFSELDLPSTTVFDYPTAEGLAEMIVSQLPPPPVAATPARLPEPGLAPPPPAAEVARPQVFTVPDFDGELLLRVLSDQMTGHCTPSPPLPGPPARKPHFCSASFVELSSTRPTLSNTSRPWLYKSPAILVYK